MSRASSFPWLSAAAVVLSLVGLVAPPFAVVAILLSAVAINQASTLRLKRIGQLSVGLSCTGLLVFGILLFLARGESSDTGTECRVGLEALMLAEDAHRKTRGRYAGSEDELGVPLAQGRAKYFLDADGQHATELRNLKVGRVGQCPNCAITIACLEDHPGGDPAWWTMTSGGKPTAHEPTGH